jgi:hypothetical protein
VLRRLEIHRLFLRTSENQAVPVHLISSATSRKSSYSQRGRYLSQWGVAKDDAEDTLKAAMLLIVNSLPTLSATP